MRLSLKPTVSVTKKENNTPLLINGSGKENKVYSCGLWVVFCSVFSPSLPNSQLSRLKKFTINCRLQIFCPSNLTDYGRDTLMDIQNEELEKC